ncbi:hypothetical protein OG474_23475 [Kribbella sp. NBC_01505]|uniref:hypothetical protein n=1 Tax=Kribbella sp. NBC_01505 TaxID=2903580 RepID=UPI00386A9889
MTLPRTLAALSAAALLATALVSTQSLAAQAAVPDLTLVSQTTGPTSDTSQQAGAFCPLGPDTHVTGVGAEVVGGRGQTSLTMYTNIEREHGTAAAVEDADGTADAWSVTGFAICATTPYRPTAVQFSPTDSSPSKTVTVACPTGAVTTSGAGNGSSNTNSPLVLDDVIPSADLKTVTVNVFEPQGGLTETWYAMAVARCGAPLPGLQRVSATSVSDSTNYKSVTATCPAGKKVVGTGHEITGAQGQVYLDDVAPNPALTSVRVDAWEDQDGTAGNWSITAYAVCATP